MSGFDKWYSFWHFSTCEAGGQGGKLQGRTKTSPILIIQTLGLANSFIFTAAGAITVIQIHLQK